MTMLGFCPICEKETIFETHGPWLRDDLRCATCEGGSIPRERALSLVLNELSPDWRNKRIHESSPERRGISAKLAIECAAYVGSQYYPNLAPGEVQWGYRNENLELLTFENDAFDITISLDVMEHVYDAESAFKEIYRTTKPGGYYICTFPVRVDQESAWERRFELMPDGTRHDLKEPEIHGNPVGDGAIVTIDWGYNLHKQISEWTGFDIRVYRFADKTHAILGENTEVIACKKPDRQLVWAHP